jgi:hypothetical protein
MRKQRFFSSRTAHTVILILLSAALCLSSGCGGASDADAETASAPESNPGEENVSAATSVESAEPAFVFTADRTEIVPGGDFASVLAALGEPSDVFEAPSCAFEGVDRIYYYPGFVINTFPDRGKDRVLSVYFTDDSAETQEGAYLGMSYEDLISVYGEGFSNETGDMITFVKGETSLAVLVEDELVRDISYYFDPAQTLVDQAE